MKRDELPSRVAVRRRALWFGPAEGALFGWYHEAAEGPPLDAVAVICAPVGHEYTRAHRTLRHLADRLARAGIAALRFDFHGIGDSTGTDLDADRLARWQRDIHDALALARELSGRRSTCLVGVRLGATLAALAAREAAVDRLVLWNPCVQGRRYVRELQAIAASAAQRAADAEGTLESAGFVMSAQTVAGLRAVDLLKERYQVRDRALVVGRDDLAPDESLNAHLAGLGIANDYLRAPGWPGMMADHQFTVVPDAALDSIVEWLRRATPAAQPAAVAPPAQAMPERATVPVAGNGPVTEELCRFGEEGRLFGILSRAGVDPARPVVLMFNAGSIHHVGANRIYVTLARSLAALGFACLRFDIEGIGDSVAREGARENHPYPDHAVADARSAMEYLKRAHGYSRFIALGVCSGAHAAFHAGLAIAHHDIAELILINPLTFYWQEGMSLEAVDRFADAHAYKRSMRDPARWLKLLRGDVNLRRLLEVAWSHPRTIARSYYDAFCETLLPQKGPRLSRDLRRLFDMNRRVSLVVAEGDPGRDILMAGARRTATRAIRSGRMRLETIPGADHTFSRAETRGELIRRLSTHLASHLG